MDSLVETAKVKIGNTLFLMGKYPERLLFHEPWIATDVDLMEHLKSNNVKINQLHANTLAKDIITVNSCY